jgi:hypothetical protein
VSLQSIRILKSAPSSRHIERIPPITRRSNANMRGIVAHRAFCVAAAIALLTASSSVAWATVEDLGTPGSANLDDASGSSGIANKAEAGLEPSQEGQVHPGQPATPFDYKLSGDYFSGAPAIPVAVENFGEVDANIQDFMLNGADVMITDPVGATGYSATIYGSLPLTLSAGTMSPYRFQASCSGDGSVSAVMNCEALALGLPSDGGTGPSGKQTSGPVSNFAPAFGAPGRPIESAKATFSEPLVYFSVANDATSPAVTNQVLDVVIPKVNSNSDPNVDTPAGFVIGDFTNTAPTPSVPEIPAPAMLVIGLGGIALARRFRLRSSARLV